nr:GyrI-like domain-containing protein [Paenibacillus typhae]
MSRGGEYLRAVEILYALSYTIKMAPKSGPAPEGYFEYVVPPLEGQWWQEGIHGVDYTRKDKFCWTAMIRQPEFVDSQVYAAAVETVARKTADRCCQSPARNLYGGAVCPVYAYRQL